MKYCCDGILRFLEESNDEKRGVYVDIKKAPDTDGYILTFMWRGGTKKNPKQFGWGFRLYYCPFCGEKLAGMKRGK